MKMVEVVALFLVFTLHIQVFAVSPNDDTTASALVNDQCNKQEKCFQCIQVPGCFWCKDKTLSLGSRRCYPNHSQPMGCTNVENPKGTVKTVVDKGDKKNQKIHPQVAQLKLRIGEKLNISMTYTDEKNRPLDLYIIMDLSCSMLNHKEKVATLSLALTENLQNLTSKLRIGFGSFVDKPLPPFGFLEDPSLLTVKECAGKPVQSSPYGFKNHLKLTDDINQFIKEVNRAGISSNIDSAEGTLDALVQSIVCQDPIGWSTEKGSRKLVVISTDGPFHLAGDGKLVGVVLPHDGDCYVDSSGTYTHSTILDYPTISDVYQKVRENDVFIIFAVTKGVESAYEQLSQRLSPFAVTQEIDNSTSITTVIEEQYKELVNSVTLLTDYKLKEYIDVKVFAQCPGERDFVNNNKCSRVGPGVNVTYKIEVGLKACPPEWVYWKTNITIYPQSSRDDYSTINLKMLCGCDCEPEKENPLLKAVSKTAKKSSECSNNGYLQCGICECYEKWAGTNCNCTVDESDTKSNQKCVDPNTNLICNNRGDCNSCGKCVCKSGKEDSDAFDGEYCECDNNGCPFETSDDGLCNVKAGQGLCKCSLCTCSENFNGSRCECPISDRSCRGWNGLSGEVCNGLGACQCGKCMCDSNYKGDYCEVQHAKLNGSCEIVQGETGKCVECLLDIKDGETDGARSERCENECKNIAVIFSPEIDRISIEDQEHICPGRKEDSMGCEVSYIIRHMNITTNVITLEMVKGEVVRKENCPTPPPLREIIIAIVGAMVVIGVMLLLLWKIVTHVQDRREYEQFEKSIHEASWNTQENPLYKSTTSKFKNPAYTDADFQESEFN